MMKSFKNFLIKYRLVVVLTLVVGIIHFVPHGYLFWRAYPNYTPLTIDNHLAVQNYETTYAYASEVNQILQGAWLVQDGQSYEYRNYPSPFVGETLPAMIIALLAKLFNSIDVAIIVSSAIFPALSFIIVVGIFKKLGVGTLCASVGSVFLIVFWDYLRYFPYPQATIKYLLDFAQFDFLPFNRAFHPQISFTIFSLGILTLLNLIDRPGIKKAILCGLVLGALYYTYLFHWTTILFALSLFSLFLLLKKEKVFSMFVIAIIVSLVVGIPYFANLYQFHQLSLASGFSITNSFPVFHFEISEIKFALFALIMGICGFWKGRKIQLIGFIIIAALIFPVLSQILIGRDIEGNHWISRVVIPMELIALWIFLAKNIQRNILLVILSITVGLSIYRQLYTAEITKQVFQINNEERQVFDFLNLNTQKYSVVASLSFSENIMMTVYTHNRIYIPRSDRTLAPVNENVERFLLLCKFYQLDPANLNLFFDSSGKGQMRGSDGSGIAQLYAYSRAPIGGKATYTLQISDEIHAKYITILNDSSSVIKKYRVDYLLVGPLEKRLTGEINNKVVGLKQVYSNQSYAIYEL